MILQWRAEHPLQAHPEPNTPDDLQVLVNKEYSIFNTASEHRQRMRSFRIDHRCSIHIKSSCPIPSLVKYLLDAGINNEERLNRLAAKWLGACWLLSQLKADSEFEWLETCFKFTEESFLLSSEYFWGLIYFLHFYYGALHHFLKLH